MARTGRYTYVTRAGCAVLSVLMLLLVAAAALLLCLSHPRRTVALPKGYRIVSSTSSDWAIVDERNNAVVVGPSVDRYAVCDDRLVTGVVSGAGPRLASGSKPGYFVLDLNTARVSDGLTEDQWIETLGSYGTLRRPRLRRP